MVRSLRLNKSLLILSILLITPYYIGAQKSIKGPLITDHGDTYTVEDAEYQADFESKGLKIVFDITAMGTSPEVVSAQVNTIARCINMHAHAGLSMEDMDISAVFHSNGTYTILNDESYNERYKTDNPHQELLSQLSDLNVKLYVCGQSLSARKVEREELHPDIKIALSAMTVFADLQMKGYALIKF
ncbi:MAG: DsrE family protein [Saprospiraceae bacterium]|nr:DsrE family protein [Saprospiraceae bacterium]